MVYFFLGELHLPLEMRSIAMEKEERRYRCLEHKMLSMAADLVLNLIYGNAACSTYFCLSSATPRHCCSIV